MQIPFLHSLRFKVGFGYVVLVVINVAVTTWAIYNFGRLTLALNHILGENYPAVMAVEKMAQAVDQHDAALMSAINRDVANGKIKFTQARNNFFQWYQYTNDNRIVPEMGPILADIRSTYEGYIIVSDSIFEKTESNRFGDARNFYADRVRPFSQRLTDNCFWLIEENQKQMARVAAETKATSDEAIIAVLFAAFLAIGLSIATMVQFTKRIIEPAERLTQTVHQIGRGQLDLKIDIETNDEIGVLSREFNKMTERLRVYEEMNVDRIVGEQKKSETIVESISDAIIVCDSEASIQLMNRSAEELLNVRERDAIGQKADQYIADDRILQILRNPTDQPLLARPYLQFDLDGRQVYLRPRASEIPSRDGASSGVVLVLQDVTQFRDLDKMKSDFMAAVSHEIRTPLTSINMSVDLMRQELAGPLTKPQQELLETSKQDCERLTKLVRELLQLSKLESGKIEMREEIVDLHRIIEATLQPFYLPFKEKGVKLKVMLEDGIPNLVGDEQQFSWVISNLVTNALRYTNAGGCVEISAERDGEYVLTRVRDTGRGIPPQYIDKIFDKFVQVKQSSTTTPGSVGLGLAIAKDIVVLYGGKIWVESEVNVGTTFSFRLPAARS